MDSASYRAGSSSTYNSISTYEATISSYNSVASVDSQKTITPTSKPNSRIPAEIGYRAVLGRLAQYGVPVIALSHIQRSSSNAYGAGASMIVYPGKWQDSSRADKLKKVVALKYMHNLTTPQGVSRVQTSVDEMNGRFNLICKELDAMAGRESRFYTRFPKLHGIAWEEVLSPAGIYLYRPIMVVEAAISDLETYIRQGLLTGPQRHSNQLRIITSIYDAINFLHQECDLLHADLKPANVLVFENLETCSLEAKLSDFGLAYDITERLNPADGRMQGTPYWSAPETYPNCPSYIVSLHAATQDYYSFGLVVWFILFGYPLGDLKNGYNEADEKEFQLMKQQGMIVNAEKSSSNSVQLTLRQGTGTRILDMLKAIYDSKWKWEVLDPTALEQLKTVEEIAGDSSDSDDDGKDIDEVRGELLRKLLADRKVRELEYTDQWGWAQTNDHSHHTYRAILETALQQYADDRRTVLHKPSQELLTKDVAYRLAALSLLGHEDPKSEVFVGMKFGPTSLNALHRLEVQQWSRKNEQKKSEEKDISGPLTEDVVTPLPPKMAETLLTQMVHEAGTEAKAGIHRQYLIASILAFGEKLPNATDYIAWTKEYANASPASERLDFVFGSMLHGKTLNEAEAHEWAFEGLTTFARTDIGDELRDMFKGIDRSLLLVPVQCAMRDYATDFGNNTPKALELSPRSNSLIFQSIIDGDYHTFVGLAAASGGALEDLVFDDCNILHFAIIHRRLEIMRYLMVEAGFVVGEGEGYRQVFKSLLFDRDAAKVIYEMNRCCHLATKKLFTRGQMSNRPLDPLSRFFKCELVALVAQTGSRSFMDIMDLDFRDGLRMMSSMVLHSSLEESEGGESNGDCNPLFAALQARRLAAFMKILHWGPVRSRPTFSPHAVVGSGPLLHHAITLMAPFFVAALLANGADPNQMCVKEENLEISPLHLACVLGNAAYLDTLDQKRQMHQMMGFPEEVLQLSTTAMENNREDMEHLRILIITLLLKNGADINKGIQAPSDGTTEGRTLLTPLDGCIKNKLSGVALFLVENGAEINPPGPNLTPLQHAINEDLTEVALLLLERGASPDGSVPLVHGPPVLNALLCNRPELFKAVLEKGTDLTIPPPDFDGDLLLHAIFESTSEFLARSLTPLDRLAAMQAASVTSFDAFIQARRKQRKIFAAHLMAMPRPELIRLMNLPSREGAIAIHSAAEYIHGSDQGDLELIQLIIDNTVNPQERGPGYTALERALVLGNMSFVQTFLACSMSRAFITE